MGKYIQQIPGNMKKNELQRITLFKTLRLGTRHKFIFTALFLRTVFRDNETNNSN